MKVLVTPTSFKQQANQRAISLLESFADELVYNDTGGPLTGDQLVEQSEGCDGILAGVDYFTSDVIERLPSKVRVLSRYGAGVDRVDLEACSKKGIIVTNTPGANATAVCELAFGLMLAAARSIPQLDLAVRQGGWPRANGMELSGKKLGIVGLGAIGKQLALRAKAFDMNVCAYDPCFDQAFAKLVGIENASIDLLCQTSEVVSLHLPLTDKTRNIIDKDRMLSMKPGAIIINTARGGLIDEEAAVELLRNGHLRALGLDAFEEEPLRNSKLRDMDKVILTPHTGAHTSEAVQRMGMMSVENLIAILTGQTCKFIINRQEKKLNEKI